MKFLPTGVTVPEVSNTTPGLAPNHAGAADVGKALIATAIGTIWSTDFGARTLSTTDGFVGSGAASYLRIGLASGSGAGVASSASAGSIRWPRGGGALAQFLGRNNGDSADVNILSYDSTSSAGAGLVTIGQTTTGLGTLTLLAQTLLNVTSGAAINLTTNSVLRLIISSTGIQSQNSMFFIAPGNDTGFSGLTASSLSSAGVNTIFRGTNNAFTGANTASGRATFQAGDCTDAGGGVTQTGGVAVLRGGNTAGSNAGNVAGDVYAQAGFASTGTQGTGHLTASSSGSGLGADKLRWNSTGIGLYTATPVAQAARVGQATNSTGVAAVNRTMSDVTTAGLADPAKVNLNFANIVDSMWNALELAIHNIGLTA